MATEAQAAANRRNAARSTGPRTKQGKAIVAQNALRHGLLARQNVVAGEDPGQFEFHRRSMLAELKPVGPTEALFAERIVGLAWRRLRAERLQNQTFDYLLGKELEHSTYGFPDSLTEKEEREMCGDPRSDPGLAVGRMLVKDCGRDKVLERLMLYEQRIESSLRRAIKDLRDLRAERTANADGGSSAEIPAQWEADPVCSGPVRACAEPVEGACHSTGILPVSSMGVPPMRVAGIPSASSGQALPAIRGRDALDTEEHGQDARATHGRDAHATETPYGVTTNGADPAKQSQFASVDDERSPRGATDPEKQSQSAFGDIGQSMAKQSQSGAGDGGHNLPCGGDSAKRSQSAAVDGEPMSDLGKQSQLPGQVSCGTEPIIRRY